MQNFQNLFQSGINFLVGIIIDFVALSVLGIQVVFGNQLIGAFVCVGLGHSLFFVHVDHLLHVIANGVEDVLIHLFEEDFFKAVPVFAGFVDFYQSFVGGGVLAVQFDAVTVNLDGLVVIAAAVVIVPSRAKPITSLRRSEV